MKKNHEMMCGWNNQLMKQSPVEKIDETTLIDMISWWNENLMKWQVDEMAN